MPLASEYCSTVSSKNVKADLDLSFRDRKFTLGGSSECWSGWIKPLEKTTYKNSYLSIPQSTWAGLQVSDFDKKCLTALKSPILDYDPYVIARSLGFSLPALPDGLYYTTYAWAESPLRLKEYWIDMTASQPSELSKNSKSVLVGYRLASYEKSSAGDIKALIFKGPNGRVLRVKADSFVIAMGGIENARFAKSLLDSVADSNRLAALGLGHFQEHPHLYSFLTCKQGNKKIPPIIANRVFVKANSKEVINNGYVKISIVAWDGEGSPKASFMINPPKNTRRKEILKNLIRPLFGKPIVPANSMSVTARCEQRPVKQSRIDFLGDKQMSLDWKVDPRDFEYYSEYFRRYASYMASRGYIDDVILSEPSVSSLAIPAAATGGAHHMSTVAYSADGNGLVDDSLRLSGYGNIYVVGSSSFPTSGFENPTIAAMATALKAVEAIIQLK